MELHRNCGKSVPFDSEQPAKNGLKTPHITKLGGVLHRNCGKSKSLSIEGL
jgi:hypothetical protein